MTIRVLVADDQSMVRAGFRMLLTGDFNINTAGFVIVGLFIATWAAVLSIWHFGHIQQKWDLAAARASVGD